MNDVIGEEYTKIYKNQKGITLIALVVTIIILLILSGVAIGTITGENGLFARAKQAKEEQIKAQVKENIKTKIMEIQAEDIPNGKDITLSTIKDKLPSKDSNISLKDYTNGDNNLNGTYEIGNKNIDFIIDNNFNVIINGEIKEGTNDDSKEEEKEIEVTTPYIGTSKTETDATQSVTDSSKIKGTPLYINFKATLDGENCKITLKNSEDEITLPYQITKNGTYTFTASGTFNGKNITKDIEVKVNKYESATELVKYDAGEWTQSEIKELQDNGLYNINVSKTARDTVGLNFTFGGFTYKGDTANKANIDNGTIITSRNQSVENSYITTKYEGWQILESKVKNGKTYVNKLVHAGSPENFVYYNTENSDHLRVEYLLSGGTRQTKYKTFSNGTTIKARNWDKYKDKTLEEKGYIQDIHAMTYDEVYAINGNSYSTTGAGDIGTNYWLASANTGNSSGVWMINNNGGFNLVINNCLGIRPVVTLREGVYITSGEGTEENPYVLGKD